MADFFNHTESDLLPTCWPLNECSQCLTQGLCSWCPMVSGLRPPSLRSANMVAKTFACVPNTHRVPVLAPFFDPEICPLWSERYELRTLPTGCNVSTITFLTGVISAMSTLVAVGLVVASMLATRAVNRRWRARTAGWWRIWRKMRYDHEQRRIADESSPLLE